MTRPLTVVQCLPALNGGGVEQGTLEIADALVRAGHRALVVSGGGRLVQALESAGAEHRTLALGRKRPGVLALVRPLRRLLHEERVDVLHLRSRLPAWIGWLAWRAMAPERRPHLVTTVHGFYSVSRYSAIMTRGERVIAVSEAIARYVRDSYPRLGESRLLVIPRGVDTARYTPAFQPDEHWMREWRETHPELAGRRVVTLAARLTRLKGHAAFLRLIERLQAGGMPVHGLIVGDEDPRRHAYAEEIRTRARGLPVSFLPHRPDLREIFKVSDLVVSTSSQPESFGRTVLEALALGTPTVGFAHGGVAEILQAIYPPGMVTPGDEAALVARARYCLTTPAAVPPSHPYSLEQMQARTLAVYTALGATHEARA